jgi:HSP20 family protein
MADQHKKEDRLVRRPGSFEGMFPHAWFPEFERLFEDFESFGPRRPFLMPRATDVRAAFIDLQDAGSSFLLKAEVPGIPKENLEVSVTSDAVELSGTFEEMKEEDTGTYVRRERNFRRFHRHVPFPEEVAAESAMATLRDGVLELRVPKREPAPETKSHRVKIE